MFVNSHWAANYNDIPKNDILNLISNFTQKNKQKKNKHLKATYKMSRCFILQLMVQKDIYIYKELTMCVC